MQLAFSSGYEENARNFGGLLVNGSQAFPASCGSVDEAFFESKNTLAKNVSTQSAVSFVRSTAVCSVNIIIN